ncbi:hypothetical protein B0H65DRAFT_514686 [Neurospora tetraspora]|uniref:Uncharacterized protein n=1 Tax=Neurospora tetraspora TaxID=94610 RepID=A0AAE0JN76_9PEZI|nr:hypothetical protein B0H65DRAFT_514686 [Neurospora tetraspora]
MASNRPTNDLDKSLLERLNALKSTSVTLDTINPSTTANDTAQVKHSFAIGPAPSVSKEDVLTERLRVLRNASSSSVPSSASPAGASPKPQSDTQAEGRDSSQSLPHPSNISQQPSNAGDTKTQTHTQILSSAWGLEEVDDQALHELLEGLQDDLNLQEDVPAEDDYGDVDLHAIANSNNNDGDDGIIENDEDRVQKLLSELAAPKPNNNSFADDHDDDNNNNSDDDNSDGEAMTKETNKILDQVQDEIINFNNNPPAAEDNNTNNDAHDPFSLPSPPSGTRTPTYTSTSPNKNDDNNTLNLPTVPSSTLSPPSGSGSGKEDDPNDTITSLTARLSHLRSTPIKTDAFGLPSVPTTTLILPADSSFSTFPPPPVSTKYQTKSTKNWVGRGETYTDQDVRRWCKVCLEDATVRCEGCDSQDGGEVYCTRCWREMHVGVGAGWEERGHRWFRIGGGKGDGSGPTTPM